MVNLRPSGSQEPGIGQFGQTVLAPRVHTSEDARKAASSYLARHYALGGGGEVSVLRLGERWLVQTSVAAADGEEPGARVVLIVNRYGFVEEVGRTSVSRQSVHRCLAGLQAMGGAERVAGEA
jgi:hypothetical protein